MNKSSIIVFQKFKWRHTQIFGDAWEHIQYLSAWRTSSKHASDYFPKQTFRPKSLVQIVHKNMKACYVNINSPNSHAPSSTRSIIHSRYYRALNSDELSVLAPNSLSATSATFTKDMSDCFSVNI